MLEQYGVGVVAIGDGTASQVNWLTQSSRLELVLSSPLA